MRHFIHYAIVFVLLGFGVSCINRDRQTEAGGKTESTQPGIAAIPAGKIYKADCPEFPNPTHLPANCVEAENCNNSDCQDSILKRHEIHESVFTSYRYRYNVQQFYRGKIIAATDIANAIQGLVCHKTRFVIYDATNNAGNNNITYGTEDIPEALDKEARYSVAFFKAILDKKTPEVFEFFKAKRLGADGNECEDIIFKVYNAGGLEVYCGDMSGLYP